MSRKLRAAAVLLVIGAAATPPALAAGTSSSNYSGKTSHREPVALAITGTKVSGKLEWNSDCTKNTGRLTDVTPFDANYNQGKFNGRGSYRQVADFQLRRRSFVCSCHLQHLGHGARDEGERHLLRQSERHQTR